MQNARKILLTAACLFAAAPACAAPVLVLKSGGPPPSDESPALEDATVPDAGTTLVLGFSEAVTGTEEDGWTIAASGGTVTVASGTGSGTDELTLTLSRTIEDGETLTLDYAQATGDLVDGGANDLEDIDDVAVTNNSTQTGEGPEDDWEYLPTAEYNLTPPTGYDGTADVVVDDEDDLQAALNTAAASSNAVYVVELTAGDVWSDGTITLPENTTGWVVIRTSNYASLPPRGTRATPADAPDMACIQHDGNPGMTTATENIIETEEGAQKYWLLGIEIESTLDDTQVCQTAAVWVGDGANDIVFDRCYAHGQTLGQVFNFFQLVGNGTGAIVDSYIDEVHVAINQSEAVGILLVDTQGPYSIINNFIAAAGENILTGGQGVGTSNPGASDITIRGNHLYKDPDWENDFVGGTFNGLHWKVKNHFELKEGTRILFEGNLCENNWQGDQLGFCVVFTAYDADISGVALRKNVFWNSDAFANIAKTSDSAMEHFLFEDNVFVGSPPDCFDYFRVNSTVEDLRIIHNTMYTDESMDVMIHETGDAVDGLIYRDNIVVNGCNGIFRSGFTNGLNTVQNNELNYDWNNNLSANGFLTYTEAAGFANWYYEDWGDIGFVDATPEDYTDFALNPTSDYAAGNVNDATDGEDLGADIDAITAALGDN